MSRIETAISQLVAAREYTVWLLDSIPTSDWFRAPDEGVTHVAWQVGHLAMAEYSLTLRRIRGERHEDDRLIGPQILAAFGRDSVPSLNPADYPTIEQIRAAFDGVHQQALLELPNLADADLDTPLAQPHRICKSRLDAVWWCVRHEMLHAGQIGLIRRLCGYPPLW